MDTTKLVNVNSSLEIKPKVQVGPSVNHVYVVLKYAYIYFNIIDTYYSKFAQIAA